MCVYILKHILHCSLWIQGECSHPEPILPQKESICRVVRSFRMLSKTALMGAASANVAHLLLFEVNQEFLRPFNACS